MPCVSRFEEEHIARALRANKGIRSRAAAALGVSPSTIGRHIASSEYLQVVEKEVIDALLDEAESVVWNAVDANNLVAAFFALKCKGKTRGWNERIDLSLSVDPGAPGLNLPTPAPDFKAWLAQAVASQKVTGSLQDVTDIDDAEMTEMTDGDEAGTLEPVSVEAKESPGRHEADRGNGTGKIPDQGCHPLNESSS